MPITIGHRYTVNKMGLPVAYDLATGLSSAVAKSWPGYLVQLVTGVLLPLGTPSTIDQLINGVPQRYPQNIDVLLGEEFLITADQTFALR